MEKDLQNAIKCLREGGILLYPTDTIWGIGCDATDEQAVARLNKIKKRKEGQPLLILVASLEMLQSYVDKVPSFVLQRLKQFSYPVTIIYPNAKNLPDNLLAQDGSIGIRIVKHPFATRLIELFGKPVVSTSANFSGEPAPGSFSDISMKLIVQVDYVVKGFRNDDEVKRVSGIYKIVDNRRLEQIR